MCLLNNIGPNTELSGIPILYLKKMILYSPFSNVQNIAFAIPADC